MTMEGDISLIYSIIELWYVLVCMDSRWLMKPRQLRSIDVFVIVEILFMIFDALVFLCVDDGITISNQSTSGDEDEKLYL